ncbi:hypothetical protein FIA58_010590 [Flavobacterium jejuense]|uniref:Uncharacterized protein n=1 Tax=Flavobacterium jejuense TaxID=1544455 RepID=A0ABX0IWD4_9FLAO|nr:hypothetical protein [Flavobacterium jejuense]NHN26124.1 hypothetical protein [Flavobacterium jejuense]
MENNEILKKKISEILKKDSDKFPFIAQLWEMEIYEKNLNHEKIEKDLNYGHFNTKSYKSTYFYKPISKIIDFSKLNE